MRNTAKQNQFKNPVLLWSINSPMAHEAVTNLNTYPSETAHKRAEQRKMKSRGDEYSNLLLTVLRPLGVQLLLGSPATEGTCIPPCIGNLHGTRLVVIPEGRQISGRRIFQGAYYATKISQGMEGENKVKFYYSTSFNFWWKIHTAGQNSIYNFRGPALWAGVGKCLETGIMSPCSDGKYFSVRFGGDMARSRLAFTMNVNVDHRYHETVRATI